MEKNVFRKKRKNHRKIGFEKLTNPHADAIIYRNRRVNYMLFEIMMKNANTKADRNEMLTVFRGGYARFSVFQNISFVKED